MSQSYRKAKALERELTLQIESSPKLLVQGLTCILITLILGTYALTLQHSIGGGDSSELVNVIHELGVAHPPGYPLYTLIGKVFSLIPIDTIAARIGFFSAIADCGAALFIFFTVLLWTPEVWAAFLAAGLFSFSPLIWKYATVPEVFALNNFFLAGFIYFSAKLSRAYSRKLFLLWAFWLGLALSHHHTFVLFALPLSLWIILGQHWQRTKMKKEILGLVFMFLLGLIPYLYLPVASSRVPYFNWGDETSLSGFLRHILRSEYGTFQLGSERTGNEGDILARLLLYLKTVPVISTYLGLLLVPMGIRATLKSTQQKGTGWVLLSCWGIYLAVICTLSNLELDRPLALSVQERFWQQPNILICLWCGLGLAALAQKVGRYRPYFVAILSIMLVGFQLTSHFREQDQSRNVVLEEYAKLILFPLPENSLLLVRGDHTSGTLGYVQHVLGIRPDVQTINTQYLSYEWARRWVRSHFQGLKMPPKGVYRSDGYNLKDLASSNPTLSVFSMSAARPWDKSLDAPYRSWSWGLSDRILETSLEPNFDTWAQANEDIFPKLEKLFNRDYSVDSWEYNVLQEYLQARHNYAVQLLNYAIAHKNFMEKPLRLALKNFEAVESYKSEADPLFYKNLGATYYQLMPFDPKAAQGVKRAWTRYIESNPSSDPQAPFINQLLRRLDSR